LASQDQSIVDYEGLKLIASKSDDTASEMLTPGMQGTGAAMHTGTTAQENYSGELRQAEVPRSSRSIDATIAEEMDSYLHYYRLLPGENHTGKIWLEMPAGQAIGSRLILDIPVADETHTFQFLVKTVSSAQ